MKTSHLLIGAALLGAGYLYWKAQQTKAQATATPTTSSKTSTFGKVLTSVARATELGLDLDQVWS